jgi:hypothetical protein
MGIRVQLRGLGEFHAFFHLRPVSTVFFPSNSMGPCIPTPMISEHVRMWDLERHEVHPPNDRMA